MLRTTTHPLTVAAALLALAGCSRAKRAPASGDTTVTAVVTPSRAPEPPASTPSIVVDPTVSFQTAESTYDARRYAEAAAMFDAYVTRRPDNPWGHYMLGLARWKTGELDAAQTALEDALEIDPHHVKSLVNLSRVLLEQNKSDEALSRISQAIALDSGAGESWRVLGRVQGQLGHVEESLDAYRHALIVDPEDTWAMNNMGLELVRAGRYDEALGPLARAVQLDSTVATFQNNLGIALERTQHYEQAAESYGAALALDSSYDKARVSRTRVAGRTDPDGVDAVSVATLGDGFASLIDHWRIESGIAVTGASSDSTPPPNVPAISKADTTRVPPR